MVEMARLNAQLQQQYFTCTVLKLPSGTFPKLITVRLPTIDSPANEARWFGSPPLTVGKSVICRRDPNDQDILIIERSGDSPDTVFDILINNSGVTLAANDAVVVDTSQDNSVTTTTTLSDTNSPGIVIEGSEDGDEVQVKRIGLVTVILDGVGSRGDFIQTSTTIKKVNPTSTLRAGCFGQLLEAGILDDTKRAVLFGLQGMHNFIEDLTAQAGGDLDMNSFDILFDDDTGIHDDSDNELIIFKKTTSAVNHFEVANAATGNGPSLAAAGETNTDFLIDAKGAGNLILQNTATGRVGIGTASPDTVLQVEADVPSIKMVDTNALTIAAVSGFFAFHDSLDVRAGFMGFVSSTNSDFVWVNQTTVGNIIFSTQNSPRLTIDASGNVGIGATAPAEKLEIEDGAATTTLQISNTSADGDPQLAFALSGVKKFTLGVDDTDDSFKIGTTAVSTNTRLTIDSSGNVGIGDTTPTGKLTNGGDRVYSTETITDTGTMADDKEIAILINAVAKTLTLPAHKVDKGIRIINNGAGTWTLSPTSGNIKGGSTAALLTTEDLFILSNGTDWI